MKRAVMLTRTPKAPEEPDLRGLRLLIAEDALLIAFDLGARLELHGCKVVGPVGRLQPALRLAKDEQLDGALLDVNLAGEFSFPVASALMARNVPYIFLSGYDDASLWPPEHRQTPRVTKPYLFADLVQVLSQHVGGGRGHRDCRRA